MGGREGGRWGRRKRKGYRSELDHSGEVFFCKEEKGCGLPPSGLAL